MRDYLLPIMLVVVAFGLFGGYTNPTFQDTKTLNATYTQYQTALDQSSQAVKMRDNLMSTRNAFPSVSIQQLESLLPDNIDNIRLIININKIARTHALQITDIAFAPVTTDTTERIGTVSPLGSVDMTFSVDASYNDFLSFLIDLQRSARLIEVQGIKFTVGTSGASAKGAAGVPVDRYTITIRTYWLK